MVLLDWDSAFKKRKSRFEKMASKVSTKTKYRGALGPRRDSFMTYIKSLAESKHSHKFRTSNLTEAAVVMSEIFKDSNEVVKIYDHCLNDDISGKNEIFYERLYDFLRAKKQIKIALRENQMSNSEIYYVLSDYSTVFPGQIEVKIANKEFKDNVNSVLNKDVNFIVNDNHAFRLELEVRTNSSDIITAACSFNDPTTTTKLNKAFNLDCFNDCENVQLISPIMNG